MLKAILADIVMVVIYGIGDEGLVMNWELCASWKLTTGMLFNNYVVL